MAASDQVGFVEALRQLYRLFSRERRRQFYRLLALMLVGALAELALVASAIPFLALLAGKSATGSLGPLDPYLETAGLDPDRLMGVAPLFIVAVLVASAVRLLLAWANQRFVVGVGHDLAVETQRRILLQPYSFHIERSTSEMIAALDKVQLLSLGVLQQVMTTFVAAIIGLFVMSLLIAVDAAAALAALAILGFAYWAVARLTRARLARASEVVGTAYDQRIRMVQESSGGIRDLIIDQSQHLYLEEFRQVNRRLARSQAATMFIAGSPRYLIEGAALVSVALLAILLSQRSGGLPAALPVLGAIALGGLRLLPLLQQAFGSWATLAANRSVIGQVLELLSLPVRDRDETTAPLPFNDAVELRQISYAYPTRPEPALAGVSLSLRAGEHVALVGETGSGKSTLADVFMGLLEPQSGSITVDGVTLETANVGAWQRNIAHVSQALFLADASIARNIAFSVAEGEIDMDRVRRAATLAEIADFVDSLPDGLETRVGERGVRLSGGQRQRIAIARALYKEAPILVLDEATNALDPATEAKVLANLFADLKRTIIVIAHRPSATGNCRLIRLKDGRIES